MSDNDDLELERSLGRAVRAVDPVPEAVGAFALAAIDLRTLDAELAELTYDSALDDEQATAVRSGSASRILSFEAGAIGLELEVTPAGSVRDLAGQLVPAQAADIGLSHRGGMDTVTADEHGRFFAAGVPAGPLRLAVTPAGSDHPRPIHTEWQLI